MSKGFRGCEIDVVKKPRFVAAATHVAKWQRHQPIAAAVNRRIARQNDLLKRGCEGIFHVRRTLARNPLTGRGHKT
jgi:hypothetical protein